MRNKLRPGIGMATNLGARVEGIYVITYNNIKQKRRIK
jgi:hypothetical protein